MALGSAVNGWEIFANLPWYQKSNYSLIIMTSIRAEMKRLLFSIEPTSRTGEIYWPLLPTYKSTRKRFNQWLIYVKSKMWSSSIFLGNEETFRKIIIFQYSGFFQDQLLLWVPRTTFRQLNFHRENMIEQCGHQKYHNGRSTVTDE